jgi:hypothetical protein
MRIGRLAFTVLPLLCSCSGAEDAGSVAAAEAGLVCLDGVDDDCMLDDLTYEQQSQLMWGGCWITGGGHIGDKSSHGGAGKNEQDSFGFNAMGMKHDYVRGEIQNTTHLGDVFHGHATWIHCWKDFGSGPEVPKATPNNAEWGGHGSWNHEEGYTWTAHLADRAEGGSHRDEYEIWIWDAGGQLVYSQTASDDLVITGGNFQIHPPNSGHPYLGGACQTEPGCP